MSHTTKKVFSIILFVTFVVFNLLHVIFPYWLIREDILWGTMVGTNIEMAALFAWILEIISLPFVLGQILYYIIFRKVKYFNWLNLVAFIFYIFQVLLFNVLVLF